MKKILIVEDELSIASFIADIVQMLGYEAKVLTSGRKVLEVAKEWRPDLVTLDIMIPPPDGIVVLDQLKKDPDTQAIPVFIVSVVANRPDLKEEFTKAQGIFEKPLDTRRFLEQLQKFSRGETK